MCYGGKTTLTANVSGGTSLILIFGQLAKLRLIFCRVGNYSVTVTDANGCSISASFTVKQQTCNGLQQLQGRLGS
jgi:hypothetical protein